MPIDTASYIRQIRLGAAPAASSQPGTDVETEQQPVSISSMPVDADTLGEVLEELANPLKTEDW